MPSRSRGTPKQTTTQRHLGHDHQTNRERLLVRHVDGRRCWWCAKPMYRDKTKNWDGHALEADHKKSRSLYGKTRADRLLHKTCNIQRGDGSHDDQRPALAQQITVSEDESLGPLAMGWPW